MLPIQCNSISSFNRYFGYKNDQCLKYWPLLRSCLNSHWAIQANISVLPNDEKSKPWENLIAIGS